MSFTPNMPLAGQTLGVTQPLVLNNFASIATAIAENHVALNDLGAGKHEFVEMPVQSPNPVTLADEAGLFAKTVSGNSEIFFNRDASADYFQVTGPAKNGVKGYTALFNGLMLQWGTATISSGNNSVAVLFSTNPNFSATPYFISITPNFGTGLIPFCTPGAINVATTGFTIINISGNVAPVAGLPFFWMAIGLQ